MDKSKLDREMEIERLAKEKTGKICGAYPNTISEFDELLGITLEKAQQDWDRHYNYFKLRFELEEDLKAKGYELVWDYCPCCCAERPFVTNDPVYNYVAGKFECDICHYCFNKYERENAEKYYKKTKGKKPILTRYIVQKVIEENIETISVKGMNNSE